MSYSGEQISLNTGQVMEVRAAAVNAAAKFHSKRVTSLEDMLDDAKKIEQWMRRRGR